MAKAHVEATNDEAISVENLQAESEGTGEISPSVAARSPHVTREKETGKTLSPDRFGQAGAPPIERTEQNPPSGARSNAGTLRSMPDGQIDMRTRMSGAITNKNHIAASGEEKVPVRIKAYCKCKIGPVWYEFHPGRVYHASQVVKDILRRANRLEVM